MKKRTARSLSLVVGALAALLWTTLATGVSEAQEHDHPPPPGDPGDPGAPAPPPDIGPRPPEERTTVVRYGPYSLDAAPTNPDGTHGHAHSGNQFAFGVQKPCSNCYITGMIADLVDTSGRTVGVRDDVQLHHMVLFNQGDGRTDATCNWGFPFPLGGLFGQRFFASGDERTPLVAQPGYGYYLGNGTFNLIWDLANMGRQRATVYYQVTYMWVPGNTPGMKNLEPVWFDLNQCGDSTISLPAGRSMRSWSWNVNRPGNIIGIGGHQHNGGINIEIKNDSTGRVICDSRARYGETPLYVDHHGNKWLSSMSTCGGAPEPDYAVPVRSGERVTIRSHYDQPEPVDDQMGIVIAYVAQADGGRECSWWERLFGWC